MGFNARRSLKKLLPAREPDSAAAASWMDRVAPVVTTMFGADLRSLAVLRIVLAMIVLIDLAGRTANLRVHYTDEGVLPRAGLMQTLNPYRWSLGLINGSEGFAQLLFLATAGAAICLLLGYKTRLMMVIVWILMMSIQIRNPLVLSGADTLLRVLLFWGMFVPLGAVWSIDHRRDPEPKRYAMSFVSFGTLGLFLQIAFMYWFTAALKTGDEWRENGTALFYALRAEQITTPFGEWLQQFTLLLQGLTWGTMALEVIAPVLLFSPFWNGKLRMAAILSLMSLHFGIMLTMNLGIFPWTSAFCMVAFLPSSFWNAAEERARAVMQVRTGRFGELRGALEQSVQGVAHAFRQQERLGLSYNSSSTPPASYGPDPADRAASTTATAPSSNAAPDPGDEHTPERQRVRLRSSLWLNAVAAFFLVFIFGWNMSTASDFKMPENSRQVAYSIGVYQHWAMFSPHPPRSTSWHVLVGQLENGELIDMLPPILRNDLSLIEPVTWDRPDNISGSYYGDKYWRKYLDAIGMSNFDGEAREFAGYVCRTWNENYSGPMRVKALVYIKVIEPTLEDGGTGEQKKGKTFEYSCA